MGCLYRFNTHFCPRKSHEHLLGRPIREKHSRVALGSIRPPIMPTNIVKEGVGQQGLKELKVGEEGRRSIF
jgi:hypothetical protein